jgi:hypothetical protein
MNATTTIYRVAGYLAVCLLLTACDKNFNPADGQVSSSQVIDKSNSSLVTVENAEQFPVVGVTQMEAPAQLSVTGSVNPDIAREVPVISLASGRIVAIRARLDDNVKKGQLLLQVQSTDATNAFDAYLKAVNDEHLANKAYVRAKDLYDHGAIPQAQLEQAEDTEKDAKADLVAAEEQLQTLGVDKNHPSPIVNIYSPITGVIVAQNVTNAAAAGVTYAGTSTLFTVADLSTVWILCDVYENDIPKVHLGQEALIHVNSYPDRLLRATLQTLARCSIPIYVLPRSVLRYLIREYSGWVCLSRRRSKAEISRPLRSFPRQPFFTCTIGIGYLFQGQESNSGALKWMRATRCPGTINRFCPGFPLANGWWRTFSSWKTRWRRNDPQVGRLCAGEPHSCIGGRSAVVCLGCCLLSSVTCRSIPGRGQ